MCSKKSTTIHFCHLLDIFGLLFSKYRSKRASIIYKNNQENFNVPYENEAITNYEVSRVRKEKIDQTVLLTIFVSLQDK